MQTIWKPEGDRWKLLLHQIVELRNRGLLTLWVDEDENGKRVYVITTKSDRPSNCF